MNLTRSFLASNCWQRLHPTLPCLSSRISFAPALDFIQTRNYAARKGTRERKKKAKVKVVVEKVGFIPHNLRNRAKLLAARESKKVDDSYKRDPVDDVYQVKYYKWVVYPFIEAVKAHREANHPEVYNKPEADLYVTVELNMQGEKKTKFVDNFRRIAAVPHAFDHGEERTILVFAKDENIQKEATLAGATLAGGVDLVKEIQNGQVLLQDFQHIVAHPDILPELVPLRGLMKRRFPNVRNGTLAGDVGVTVAKFLNGINYQAIKDEFEKDFGQIDAVIGKLNMDEKHLEENFTALINDINSQKTKEGRRFYNEMSLKKSSIKRKAESRSQFIYY